MNSYADVGGAHAELLLVTCLKRKTLWEKKPPPASASSVAFTVAPSTSKRRQVQSSSGKEGGRGAVERVYGPPVLSQDPSLHHPSGGFPKSLCSPKQL
jgi:hypothetical protein